MSRPLTSVALFGATEVFFIWQRGRIMFKKMREDIAAIRERDPAAMSNFEVFWLYNGYKAIRSHRRANLLQRHGLRLLARWESQRCVR